LPSSKSNRTRYIVLALAYAVSLGSLVWTLRDAELDRLVGDVAGLNPLWIGLGIASMLSVYLVQGFRWSLILAPVGKLDVLQGTRAVFAGLFVSEVFPFRAGEIIRCYLVGNLTKLPFSVTLASVLIERMFDGLVMWVGLRFALRNTQIPRSQQLAVDSLGVFVLLGMIILGIALFRPKLKHARMPASGWRKRWFVLQEDLALIGHSGYLWAALAATVPYLLLQVVPVYLLFREYDFKLSFGVALALMMLIRLAAALPQAPATLGLFQVLTREFLVLGFGIIPDEAARFSLVLWGVIKIPLLIAGAIAVAVTGTKIGELTKAAREAHQSSS
jgi:glycosyltransferase 2 family protein